MGIFLFTPKRRASIIAAACLMLLIGAVEASAETAATEVKKAGGFDHGLVALIGCGGNASASMAADLAMGGRIDRQLDTTLPPPPTPFMLLLTFPHFFWGGEQHSDSPLRKNFIIICTRTYLSVYNL
jgi:hypothetical protein